MQSATHLSAPHLRSTLPTHYTVESSSRVVSRPLAPALNKPHGSGTSCLRVRSVLRLVTWATILGFIVLNILPVLLLDPEELAGDEGDAIDRAQEAGYVGDTDQYDIDHDGEGAYDEHTKERASMLEREAKAALAAGRPIVRDGATVTGQQTTSSPASKAAKGRGQISQDDKGRATSKDSGKEKEKAEKPPSSPHKVEVSYHTPLKKAPLPPKYADLLKKLRHMPLIFTRERLTRQRRISCGGTEVVGFRNWSELHFNAETAFKRLNDTLPAKQPHLASIAKNIRASRCFNSTVYRRRGCEADVFVAEEDVSQAGKPTCAVVGNSGRLRYEAHGPAIDAADVVFRFNQGRTQSFERWVGSKSTFRIFNSAYVGPKQPGETSIAQIRDEHGVRQWSDHVQKRGVGNSNAFLYDPEFLCETWNWVDKKGKKPSSGLVGVLAALRMCKRGHVDVYGFQYDAYFDKEMKPHYFDWERPKPGREGVHPFEREKAVFELLEAADELVLHF